jgi:beta-galactosidase
MNRPVFAAWIWLGILLAGCAPAGFAATAADEINEDHALASRLVTPHKPWGRGYAGGPLRALFFVHAGHSSEQWNDIGTRLREVVELGQRFDLQAEAVLYGGSGKAWGFHGQKLGEERAERLLALPRDLYVIAGFPMEKLPARLQYLIIEQVAKGAGLLCCGPGAAEFMTSKRQLQPLPAMLSDALPVLDGRSAAASTRAYRLGRGRGVWLCYGSPSLTPSHEFTWRGLAEYDYRMLLVGRAALWAAAREGQVSLGMAAGQPLRLDRSGPAVSPDVTLLSSASKTLDTQVSLELRRAWDGQTTSLGLFPAKLVPGQPARVAARLPRLRSGDYFLDAIVRSPRGVEAFGAEAIMVESDFGVGTVEMQEPFVERGRQILGRATLRGTPPAGSRLRIQFRDSYGRIVRQQEFPVVAGQGDYRFAYQADASATILMRAEAVLRSADEEVELKDAAFTVPKRRHGQFNFVQWDAPNDVPGYYAWRLLQQAGMNISLVSSMGGLRTQPAVLRACDATVACYSTRLLDEKDAQGRMQPVCWNHEPAVSAYVEKIVANQQLLRQQGVFVYSLGDEGVTLGCCTHPACMAAYRCYLESQYGTVDKLNASWGSAYRSFAEVDLLDSKDNMESAAARSAPARALDRQAFARANLARFSGRFGAAYKRLDPQAITGFEGTGDFGDDYDAILAANGFYGPYPGIGDDLVRSAAPRALIRSNWMGYSKTPDALCDAAWRMVLRGVDSVWFWMWDGIGSFRGYLSPTLDFWPATAELTDEMRPVRQGLGDLLLQSKSVHSGIALFYSVPSAIADRIHPGSQFIVPHSTHQLWTQYTSELGLDFRYLTGAMLKRGALDPREFKTILLPMAQAVSPEEAETIRHFVRSGGTLIADVRPGIYDGHCKPASPGMLDDLFGIRRAAAGKAVHGAADVHGSLDGRMLDVRIPDAVVDSGIQAVGAQSLGAAGQTPLVLVNRVGAGRAILLGFQLPSPGSKDPDPPAAEARRLLAWLYQVAGVEAAVSVSSPAGEPLPLVETRVWQNGDATIVGVYRQMRCAWFSPKSGMTAGEPVAAKIVLPAVRHVYDLRAGRYLGSVARIDARLRWGRANFYLLAPREIAAPQIRLSTATPAPGQTITATVTTGTLAGDAQRYALWMEIVDPQGQRPLWGQQVLVPQRGAGQVQVPVAFNDLPGRWRIRATELFSGRSAEAAWEIP